MEPKPILIIEGIFGLYDPVPIIPLLINFLENKRFIWFKIICPCRFRC